MYLRPDIGQPLASFEEGGLTFGLVYCGDNIDVNIC